MQRKTITDYQSGRGECTERLQQYRALFERICHQVVRRPHELAECLADVVCYAQRSGCGIYSSNEIEQAVYALARDPKLIPEAASVEVEKDTLLIVMTEAYAIGGHTRVVERWIELDRAHRYSLVLTRQGQGNPLPKRLVDAVRKSGGEIVRQAVSEGVMSRAAQLRLKASGFEKVILHIHTDDVIPLLAFGTESFQRPVGLYNHADHLFWLGVGIADGVAELRKSKIEFSRCIRGVERTQFVGIPMDTKEMVRPDRAEAKRRLGYSSDTPVLVTCGSATKYDPALGMDFLVVARRVLLENPRAVLIGIGMTFKDLPSWKSVNRELGGRIRVEGLVPFEHLYDYYDAADLYLDSYPVGGGTALPDALCRSCPVLSLPSPDGKMDWIYDCGGYCATEDELVRRAGEILRGAADVSALLAREYRAYVKVNSPSAFLVRLQGFLTSLESPHRVRKFAAGFNGFSNLDRYHLAEHSRVEYIFGSARSFVACYYRIDPQVREKRLRCLGFELCIKRHELTVGLKDV